MPKQSWIIVVSDMQSTIQPLRAPVGQSCQSSLQLALTSHLSGLDELQSFTDSLKRSYKRLLCSQTVSLKCSSRGQITSMIGGDQRVASCTWQCTQMQWWNWMFRFRTMMSFPARRCLNWCSRTSWRSHWINTDTKDYQLEVQHSRRHVIEEGQYVVCVQLWHMMWKCHR